MKEKINVFSTYALDKVVNDNGETLSEQSGGPMVFIKNALEDSNVPFETFHGDRVNVEILLNDKGEFGKVPVKPKILSIPQQNSNWIIVSTLLNEWNLSSIDTDQNQKIFVDIQGYVRNGEDFGKKRQWEEVSNFSDNIFCLKGTKQEMQFLPKEVLENQKKKLLIITDGGNGVEVYHQGSYFLTRPTEVLKTPNTIGAGDTFFGYFIAGLYNGLEIRESTKSAMEKTSQFLKGKI